LAVKKEGKARSRVKATNLGESDTTIDIHNNQKKEEFSEYMEDVVHVRRKNLDVQSCNYERLAYEQDSEG
jgi:hypothetical protein